MTHRVGIEVGATSVRVVEVEAGPKPRLIAFAEKELPRGVVVDGVVANSDVVRDAIAECLSKGHFRRRRRGGPLGAHLAIAGLRAITREIELPHLGDEELEAAARLQAFDIVPFPVDEAVLSIQRLNPVADVEPPADRVLIAAAHRDLVVPLVDAAESAGVVVLGVEFAPFAILRALATLETPGAEAIVSIGADLTTVVIHEQGEPLLVRTIAGGGATTTRAIAAALDLPFNDAEALKLRLGDPTSAPPLEAAAAARDSSMALISEIRSSLQYYATLPGRNECEAVVLTGGGAELADFADRLDQQVLPPVLRRDPLANFGIRNASAAQERLARLGAVVIGTALPPTPGSRAIDLLPPEVLTRRRERRITVRFAGGAALLVVALGALGALRYVQVERENSTVTALGQSIAILNRQIPKYDAVQRLQHQLTTESSLAMPLVSHEINWPAVVAALDRFTPSSVSAADLDGAAATTSPAGAAGTASPGKSSATLAASSSLPAPNAVIGTIGLTLTAKNYPAFKQWYDEIEGSGYLTIETFSGLTGSKTGVMYSAELGIEGTIHTDRLARFNLQNG